MVAQLFESLSSLQYVITEPTRCYSENTTFGVSHSWHGQPPAPPASGFNNSYHCTSLHFGLQFSDY